MIISDFDTGQFITKLWGIVSSEPNGVPVFWPLVGLSSWPDVLASPHRDSASILHIFNVPVLCPTWRVPERMSDASSYTLYGQSHPPV